MKIDGEQAGPAAPLLHMAVLAAVRHGLLAPGVGAGRRVLAVLLLRDRVGRHRRDALLEAAAPRILGWRIGRRALRRLAARRLVTSTSLLLATPRDRTTQPAPLCPADATGATTTGPRRSDRPRPRVGARPTVT